MTGWEIECPPTGSPWPPSSRMGEGFSLARGCGIIPTSKTVPRAFGGDAHRANFLRSAVIGYPCAMQPLSRMDTNDVSLQDLYGELHAALSSQTDSANAVALDMASSSSRDLEGDPDASVLCGRQGRY